MTRPVPSRVDVVRVDRRIMSIYDRDGVRMPLAKLRMGYLVPDAAAALLELHLVVERDGGQLLVSDCLRSFDQQAVARRKYERWLEAGKPAPGSPGFDAERMKAAPVTRPGRGFHPAGRATDVDHDDAAPDSVPYSQRLDWLWERAIPLGWRPVIKQPDEHARESWHLDYLGPWAAVNDRLGYTQAALCATLDLAPDGLEDHVDRAWWKWVQAQLQRAGFDLGDVDGWPGRKTQAAFAATGLVYHRDLEDNPELHEYAEALEVALQTLPSQPSAVWTA